MTYFFEIDNSDESELNLGGDEKYANKLEISEIVYLTPLLRLEGKISSISTQKKYTYFSALKLHSIVHKTTSLKFLRAQIKLKFRWRNRNVRPSGAQMEARNKTKNSNKD